MVDYKEILRLAANPSNSQRQIAASVGSSHHTVKEVLETAKLKGIEWPIEDSVSNGTLMSILFPEKYATVSGYLEPDYEYFHRELAKPGVTMTLLCKVSPNVKTKILKFIVNHIMPLLLLDSRAEANPAAA